MMQILRLARCGVRSFLTSSEFINRSLSTHEMESPSKMSERQHGLSDGSIAADSPRLKHTKHPHPLQLTSSLRLLSGHGGHTHEDRQHARIATGSSKPRRRFEVTLYDAERCACYRVVQTICRLPSPKQQKSVKLAEQFTTVQLHRYTTSRPLLWMKAARSTRSCWGKPAPWVCQCAVSHRPCLAGSLAGAEEG